MIIPQPQSCTVHEGTFCLSSRTRIAAVNAAERCRPLVQWLGEEIEKVCGITCVCFSGAEKAPTSVELSLDGTVKDHTEAYTLSITSDRTVISAASPEGIRHGVTTFLQLTAQDKNDAGHIDIPCCHIEDRPVFSWRGILIDCCRHFIGLDYLKKAVDYCAGLKLNRLHLHLTENEGWRIQIREFPLLTDKGGHLSAETSRNGFFTQQDLRELVVYAQVRGITVVPEIDMPGHCFAAVSCFPDLCCTGRPQWTHKGQQQDLFCAGNEEVFAFLDQVIREVSEIFPGEWIHIGGDEAPKNRWKECPKCQKRMREEGIENEEALQGYFINRVAAIAKRYGKKLIGWDECAYCGVDPAVTIQWWRHGGYVAEKTKPAERAVRGGHHVIASPNSFCYLDWPVKEKPSFPAFRTADLRRVYEGQYVPDSFSIGQRNQILGAECAVWTEYITGDRLDVMIFPKILAVSELMWRYPQKRDFDDFKKRVDEQTWWWMRQGISFGPADAAGADSFAGY